MYVVAGYRDLSDHVPIRIRIAARSSTTQKRIPRHVIENAAFAERYVIYGRGHRIVQLLAGKDGVY